MKDDEIIITDNNETMTYSTAKKFREIVFRVATKEESEAFIKENEYWHKQSEEEQMNSSYHELPD